MIQDGLHDVFYFRSFGARHVGQRNSGRTCYEKAGRETGLLRLLRSISVLFAVLIVAGFSESAISQTDATKLLEAVRTSEPPKINGTLDDLCWKKAPSATDFVDIFFDKLAPDQIVVYLLYDDENIYIAFRCYDSQPERIIARETKRDSSLWNDDHFSFWIDPFHAHQSQYRSSSTVNAIGTQTSKIAGGRASKTEWKGDWKAAASRTHDGWTGEMAIPFAILSHPAIDEPATIGMNFARKQQRTEVYSFWSNIGPQYYTEKDRYLVGLVFPNRRAKRLLAIMTYAFGGVESVESDDETNYETTFRAGLDAKYPITSEMTFVASVNPDFSNVAQIVESIDFSYRKKPYYFVFPSYIPATMVSISGSSMVRSMISYFCVICAISCDAETSSRSN